MEGSRIVPQNIVHRLDQTIEVTALHLDEAALLHNTQRGMGQVRTGAGREALPTVEEVKQISDVQGLPQRGDFHPDEMSAPDHRRQGLEGVRDPLYEQDHLHHRDEILLLMSVGHDPHHP